MLRNIMILYEKLKQLLKQNYVYIFCMYLLITESDTHRLTADVLASTSINIKYTRGETCLRPDMGFINSVHV